MEARREQSETMIKLRVNTSSNEASQKNLKLKQSARRKFDESLKLTARGVQKRIKKQTAKFHQEKRDKEEAIELHKCNNKRLQS